MSRSNVNAWGKTWVSELEQQPKPNPPEDKVYAVSREFRDKVWRPDRRKKRQYHKTTPLMQDLMDGKTLIVDAKIPLGDRNRKYGTLYSAMINRGYLLEMHMFDDPDNDVFRGLIMWATPMITLWQCSRCGGLVTTGDNTIPRKPGCTVKSKINAEIERYYHSWNQVRNYGKLRRKAE